MLKVLGKEFEEEPFFKRVFLNITCKTSIRVLLLSGGFFYAMTNQKPPQQRRFLCNTG
jgi:hypothetical protein